VNAGARNLVRGIEATTVRRVGLLDVVAALAKGVEILLAVLIGVVFPVAIWALPGLIPPDARVACTLLVLAGWLWHGLIRARQCEVEAEVMEEEGADPGGWNLTGRFDPSAAFVETPVGLGQYVDYDATTNTVCVEMDFRYLVAVPADQCWLAREEVTESHEKGA
jgi:hypothetical protein